MTSRQSDVIGAAQEWVNKHFPNTFTDIYFANYYSQSGTSKTKAQMCDEIGVGMLIEDSIEYALECFGQKREIFLLDCPWNQHLELPQGIRRFFSWAEIIQAI